MKFLSRLFKRKPAPKRPEPSTLEVALHHASVKRELLAKQNALRDSAVKQRQDEARQKARNLASERRRADRLKVLEERTAARQADQQERLEGKPGEPSTKRARSASEIALRDAAIKRRQDEARQKARNLASERRRADRLKVLEEGETGRREE